MQMILKELGEFHEPRVVQDNTDYPLYHVKIKINVENSGIASNFKRLYDAGLFVGNIGRNGDEVHLIFFTKESP